MNPDSMYTSDTQTNDFKNENRTSRSDFTEGSILQKLIPFMLPILGALVLQAAYGAVDLLVVMVQGLFQTLLIRLPMSYYMSIQPNASLTKIGLAAPTSTLVGVLLNVVFFLYLQRKTRRETTAGN